MRIKNLFVCLSALLLVVTGCKKEVESVVVMPESISLSVGETYQLQSVVKPDKAPQDVHWVSSNPEVATVNAGGLVTAVKAGSAIITVKTNDGGRTATCKVAVIPDGVLSGVFSVSDTRKVYFSQGNLVATIVASGIPTSWKFATNQYDYLGEGGANKTIGIAAGDVDLFGWSTDATKYGISTSTSNIDYSGNFIDWGENIDDGNTWHTLSKDEWVYLFEGRTNASSLYKFGVTVCGKTNCVVIAPDGFTGSIADSYDAATWSAAEAAGLVCLPAAGDRSGSIVYQASSSGFYWSSSAYDGNSANGVFFNSGNVRPGFSSSGNRNYGYSVRLVTDVN